jgi:hypothetical protein
MILDKKYSNYKNGGNRFNTYQLAAEKLLQPFHQL